MSYNAYLCIRGLGGKLKVVSLINEFVVFANIVPLFVFYLEYRRMAEFITRY